MTAPSVNPIASTTKTQRCLTAFTASRMYVCGDGARTGSGTFVKTSESASASSEVATNAARQLIS